MKNTFAKMFTVCALAGVLGFALTACDDSSSASGDNGSGGNRGGIPDTVETFMELSDYDCGKSQKCVATYLTEYHDMAVCDGDNGWVIGTLIEKMDCDFSSSSDKSSDSKSNDPAEVTDGSSDSNSSGTTTKSSSSSADKVASSSSSITLATPCKMETEDNCEYGTLTDERDGQEYKTVKIGDQVWMAQNLNYEIAGSRCYERNESNCARSGRFYTWAAAMDSIAAFSDNGKGCGKNLTCSPAYPVRGICPGGWHLPSKDEWNILIETVGGASAAGKTLRTTTGWLYKENGSDAYSFSALPVGYSTHGDFGTPGYSANFWSSTENGTSAAYAMQMVFGEEARLFNHFKYYDVPVRCVKDSE